MVVDPPEGSSWDTSGVVWETPDKESEEFGVLQRMLAANGVSIKEEAFEEPSPQPPEPQFSSEWV